ncbi:MAG TPA: hypothetical protein VHM92_01780 [Allosphingosinicella sp.]|nr:hypothetical protein [Allosphingosinicella sp.]
MRRYRNGEGELGLRTGRAADAFSGFCLAWIDAGREIAFGSTQLLLDTADDIAAASCGSERVGAVRRRRRGRDEAPIDD